jgi:hypothetical protein
MDDVKTFSLTIGNETIEIKKDDETYCLNNNKKNQDAISVLSAISDPTRETKRKVCYSSESIINNAKNLVTEEIDGTKVGGFYADEKEIIDSITEDTIVMLSVPTGLRLDTLGNASKIIDFMNLYGVIPEDLFDEYETEDMFDNDLEKAEFIVDLHIDDDFVSMLSNDPDSIGLLITEANEELQKEIMCGQLLEQALKSPEFPSDARLFEACKKDL